MTRQKSQAVHSDVSGQVSAMAARLLPVIARKKMANNVPQNAGASYFYEVGNGWETDVLRQDDEIFLARNTAALEKAFGDPAIRTVFIPADGSITKKIALRICRRYGRGKTIFFEIG